jgi:hypothetical protein
MGDMEKILSDLGKVSDLLWDALEVASMNVQYFFLTESSNMLKIDPSLGPHILRYWAKQYINDNLWRVEHLAIENLPANGISLIYNNYHARVWKYTGGFLPAPGTSSAKNAFLRQQQKGCRYHQLVLFPDGEDVIGEEEPVDNLVFLWEVDQEYQLQNLRLSYPKYCVDVEDGVEAKWSLILNHPAATKHRPDPSDFTDKDRLPIYDLPLEPIEEFISEEEDVDESGI